MLYTAICVPERTSQDPGHLDIGPVYIMLDAPHVVNRWGLYVILVLSHLCGSNAIHLLVQSHTSINQWTDVCVCV
jgi:hypothetical protein